jgi:hypothetical protein
MDAILKEISNAFVGGGGIRRWGLTRRERGKKCAVIERKKSILYREADSTAHRA